MPELPEVEIAGRQLRRWLAAAPLTRVEVHDPTVVRSKLSTSPADAVATPERALAPLVGTRLVRVERHGKRLGLRCGDTALLLHLGMSGRWVRGARPERHVRLTIATAAAEAHFVDPRRFGCVAPVAAAALAEALRTGHGPDALDEAVDGPGLASRLRGRRAVKVALLDQAVIAGLGNIHAAEALFRAGVDPRTRCDALSPAQHDALARSIPAQLAEVIAAEDGDEVVYVTDGSRPNPFAVYGRHGAPCRRCGAEIVRFVQAGRGTWCCLQCQR